MLITSVAHCVGIAVSKSGAELVYKQDLNGGAMKEVVKHLVNDIINVMSEVCDSPMPITIS